MMGRRSVINSCTESTGVVDAGVVSPSVTLAVLVSQFIALSVSYPAQHRCLSPVLGPHRFRTKARIGLAVWSQTRFIPLRTFL